jgi:hypothetical protein
VGALAALETVPKGNWGIREATEGRREEDETSAVPNVAGGTKASREGKETREGRKSPSLVTLMAEGNQGKPRIEGEKEREKKKGRDLSIVTAVANVVSDHGPAHADGGRDAQGRDRVEDKGRRNPRGGKACPPAQHSSVPHDRCIHENIRENLSLSRTIASRQSVDIFGASSFTPSE